MSVPIEHWAGHRDDQWDIFELLSRDEMIIGTLAVDGGEITSNINTEVRTQGSLQISTADPLDVFGNRVQITRYVQSRHGVTAHPLGRFLIESPGRSITADSVTHDLALYDKTKRLLQVTYPDVYAIPAGTHVTSKIAELILATGETSMTIEDSNAILATTRTWTDSPSTLRIINDLLESIGYFAIHTDGRGAFQVQPYVRPQQRPVRWRFEDGEAALHNDDIEEEFNEFEIPNRIFVVSPGDGETPGAYAVAVNNNTESRYAVDKIGYNDATYQGESADGSAVPLQSMADRYLAAATPSRALNLTHGWIPLAGNDVVEVIDSITGIDALATVQETTTSLNALEDATTRVREVVRNE